MGAWHAPGGKQGVNGLGKSLSLGLSQIKIIQ